MSAGDLEPSLRSGTRRRACTRRSRVLFMDRFLSLMVVLAHLGVASIPCVESELGPMPGAMARELAMHPMPDAAARESATAEEHANHAQPAEHAQPGHDRHPAHAPPKTTSHAEAIPRVKLAGYELRAPCFCGCSQRWRNASTTTPPPPSLAILPVEPARLLAVISTVAERAPDAWPASPAETPEPIPIPS